MKKLIATIILFLGAVAFGAEPTVTDVTARQRYPWNGLVDITCMVSGINGTTNGLEFAVAAVMPDSGNVRKVSTFWVVQNGTNSLDLEVLTNGNYRLLWDAQAEFGQVIHSNMVMRVTVVKSHRKVQLWKNGPYWAETNIGAEAPHEYGYYFWWGDTVGYKRENDAWVASDGSSSNFSFDEEHALTHGKDTATLQSEGWITTDNTLTPDTDNTLTPNHDAAHVQWGGKWRIPTKQEFDDLLNKCDWNWTTINGIPGWGVRGRDSYVSASIFLPIAGYGFRNRLFSDGGYWSSVPGLDDYNSSWYLFFGYYGDFGTSYDGSRSNGYPVRPVQGFERIANEVSASDSSIL